MLVKLALHPGEPGPRLSFVATPKSASFTMPVFVVRTLAPLMSLWITPAERERGRKSERECDRERERGEGRERRRQRKEERDRETRKRDEDTPPLG